MKLFDKNTHLLLRMFCGGTERETLDYVVNGTREILGDTAPDREAVKAFLSDPEEDDQLSTGQRVVVIDQLLEYLEVNIRTTFDLIRYKVMKEAGIVRDMDEFLLLLRSGSEKDDL